jgi:hypothetical protein
MVLLLVLRVSLIVPAVVIGVVEGLAVLLEALTLQGVLGVTYRDN